MGKKIAIILCISIFACTAHAQLKDLAKEVIDKFTTLPADTSLKKISADTAAPQKLIAEIQSVRMRELKLLEQIEYLKNGNKKQDSIRQLLRRNRIDSLRQITPAVPLVVEGDTLFSLYAARGAMSALERTTEAATTILSLAKRLKIEPDSVYLYHAEYNTDIMYGEKIILVVTEDDALWAGTTREKLATYYRERIVKEMQEIHSEHGMWQWVLRIFLFILVLVSQYFFFRFTVWLFRKTKLRIQKMQQTKLQPFMVRNYELLNTDRQVRLLTLLANAVRYVINIVELILVIPLLFAIFPQTKALALRLFSYIIDPVKYILVSVVNYIPKLFTIIVICLAIRYIIRGLKYLANEITSERLKISGFYPDWAQPTYTVIRFLLYAFMIAMIYPYLPGSDTGIFQGISVFVGLIVSLGSSTVIGNVIAGLVITYMRPFKIGDFIKLNDTTGNVIEKTPFVTRIKTPKNEVVTVPNSFIMSSHTTNFSSSARRYGLIIHTTVTIGYDAPWRTVHRLLIDAAKATEGVMAEPEPFVLETELSDFYPVYQINAYIQDANSMARIYSNLHKNIQDQFNAAGVEIMSPHYRAERDGNATTIPKDWGQ